MTHATDLSQLHNESDVEQKVVMPMLTLASPKGCGILPVDIRTKADLRQLTIDKRKNARLFYPDYIVTSHGLPVCIVEAKPPSDTLGDAYREARMYAGELNGLFPSKVNPVAIVVATNGAELWLGPADAATPALQLTFDQLFDPTSEAYAQLRHRLDPEAVSGRTKRLWKRLRAQPFRRAVTLLGGSSVRDEEIGINSFGAGIQMRYRHLFNPSTIAERRHVVRHAYVPSRRRDRYVDPIDKLVRAAIPPSVSDATTFENTTVPRELTGRLQDAKSMLGRIALLIGSVGSGKTTFVDHLQEVSLPAELRESTVWIHLDMNACPSAWSEAQRWVLDELIIACRAAYGDGWDTIDTLRKVYSVELARLERGRLQLLKDDPTEYNRRLEAALADWEADKEVTAVAWARHLSGDRGRALVLVLDNGDRRVRDDQLMIFQMAQWLQTRVKCILIVPLRDVTYDLYRHVPPLDTALKDLVFRIEPPGLSAVLNKRISLVLKEMAEQGASGGGTLRYRTPNGIEVSYPVEKQQEYLEAIKRSVFSHDRFVRRLLMGLAGQDIRRAMEIFLEFCTSGHIGEDDILRMTQGGGDVLPYHVVVRVMLRRNRRFYDGESGFIGNIF